MIVAADASVRAANCYSFSTKSVERVIVVAIAVVKSNGGVSVVGPFTTLDIATRDYELAALEAYSPHTCVVDGLPARPCRRNIALIKTGNVPGNAEGWICGQYGAYAVCADFEADRRTVSKAIELNAAAHDIANEAADAHFRYLLAKMRCVTAHGIHVNPELNYFPRRPDGGGVLSDGLINPDDIN